MSFFFSKKMFVHFATVFQDLCINKENIARNLPADNPHTLYIIKETLPKE